MARYLVCSALQMQFHGLSPSVGERHKRLIIITGSGTISTVERLICMGVNGCCDSCGVDDGSVNRPPWMDIRLLSAPSSVVATVAPGAFYKLLLFGNLALHRRCEHSRRLPAKRGQFVRVI